MADKVVIEGLDELNKKLDSISNLNFLDAALQVTGEHIKGKVNVYPPSSEANSPPGINGRWYERNFGPKSITGWYKRTSESLSKKWYSNVRRNFVEIGNSASYAPFVQGKERQAKIHAQRGWKTLEDTAEEEIPFIVETIQGEIDKRLE